MSTSRIYCGIPEPSHVHGRHQRLGLCHGWACSSRSRYEELERRLWRERNQTVIQRLSQMIGARHEEIGDFLYDLTLQKYSQLLNPKDCGWSFCKVPLCYPNVCDRYMGIFDRHGNLRDPTHPKCLLHLLQLLQDFISGADIPTDCQDLPIYAEYPGGRRYQHRRFQKIWNNYEQEVLEAYEEHKRESSIWHMGSLKAKKFEMKIRKPSVVVPELDAVSQSNSPRMSVVGPYTVDQDVKRTNTKIRTPKTLGRHSVFLNDELALAHDKPHHDVEDLVKAAIRRRHSKHSYVGPIGNLRQKRIHILIKQLIEQRRGNINPKDLREEIRKFDLGPHEAKVREKELANEISTLYSSIVQNKSDNSIQQYLSRRKSKPQMSLKHQKRSLGTIQLPLIEPMEQKRNTMSKSMNRRTLQLSLKRKRKSTATGMS